MVMWDLDVCLFNLELDHEEKETRTVQIFYKPKERRLEPKQHIQHK
jgi:hypothetical protein